jgi:hypothetical protein
MTIQHRSRKEILNSQKAGCHNKMFMCNHKRVAGEKDKDM